MCALALTTSLGFVGPVSTQHDVITIVAEVNEPGLKNVSASLWSSQ